ncbi:MAG: CBS domain-containing protein [Ichthyobacteriaceae bacterium]|nr:CBS domain-containing protein [Ichthyobacteriaceae bacterium]
MTKDKMIKDIMTTELITVMPTDDLEKAKQVFEKNKIRHILVVDNKKLVGILSQHDLLRVSFGNTYGDDQATMDDAIVNMLKVTDVMRHKPVTINIDDTIEDAIFILLNRRFHSLPVVDNNNIPIGIVTTTDFLKLLVPNHNI